MCTFYITLKRNVMGSLQLLPLIFKRDRPFSGQILPSDPENTLSLKIDEACCKRLEYVFSWICRHKKKEGSAAVP